MALAIEAGCQHFDADDLERDDDGDLACGDCRATWAESSLWAY